jgi:hypothetical protein
MASFRSLTAQPFLFPVGALNRPAATAAVPILIKSRRESFDLEVWDESLHASSLNNA